MSLNIPGNALKHSGKCRQTFRGECPTFQEMLPNIPGECRQTFQRMSLNNPENIGKDAGACRETPRWKVLKLSDE